MLLGELLTQSQLTVYSSHLQSTKILELNTHRNKLAKATADIADGWTAHADLPITPSNA
jgi:hypothetical protein